MRGVITHVSNRKRSTTCITTLKSTPSTSGFTPYRHNILDNRGKLFLTFLRSPNTAGKSSSKAVMIQLRYFNDVTKFSGRT